MWIQWFDFPAVPNGIVGLILGIASLGERCWCIVQRSLATVASASLYVLLLLSNEHVWTSLVR